MSSLLCCCCLPRDSTLDEREPLVQGGPRAPAGDRDGFGGATAAGDRPCESAERSPPAVKRGPVVSARRARPPPGATKEHGEHGDRNGDGGHGDGAGSGRTLVVRAVGVPDVDSRVADAAETFANLQAEHMGVTRARRDLCEAACCAVATDGGGGGGDGGDQHGLAECFRKLELRHETELKLELKGYNFSLAMKEDGAAMPTSLLEPARLVSELSARARAFLGISTRLDEMMASLLRTESRISRQVTETNTDYADSVRTHDNMRTSLAELRRGRKDAGRYKEDISILLQQVAEIAGLEQPCEE